MNKKGKLKNSKEGITNKFDELIANNKYKIEITILKKVFNWTVYKRLGINMIY